MHNRIACGLTMPANPAKHVDHQPSRLRCPRCQRPDRRCLCAWVRPTDTQLPVLVLQHPLEAAHAKSSTTLLHLSLRNCRVEVGERFDEPTLTSWLTDGTVLLYPGLAAAPTTEARPRRLVLLDGTWRKTRKLLHLNPLLQQLPRLSLPDPPPSLYTIRKAQLPEQRSTLEAACLALGQLEGRPAHYAPLLQAFDGWVRSHDGARSNTRRHPAPEPPVEKLIPS